MLRRSGLRAFVLSTGNLTAEQTVAVLLAAQGEMERLAGQLSAPFLCRITKDGSVRHIA
jgi:hypothetical protein